jgi:hypothetical protein
MTWMTWKVATDVAGMDCSKYLVRCIACMLRELSLVGCSNLDIIDTKKGSLEKGNW